MKPCFRFPLSVKQKNAWNQLRDRQFCLFAFCFPCGVVRRKGEWQAFILVTVAFLLASCGTVPPPVTRQRDSTITKQMALSTAIDEIRRRKFVLPTDYQTEITESSFRPEVGPVTQQFSVAFLAGERSHRVRIYLVTINRSTGEVDFVYDLIAPVDSTPPEYIQKPFGITKQNAVRLAAIEIRRRGLVLPAPYKTRVAKSIITPKVGPDIHAFFVSFLNGEGTTSRQLYQVAVNQDSGRVEFVFDFLAGTMK